MSNLLSWGYATAFQMGWGHDPWLGHSRRNFVFCWSHSVVEWFLYFALLFMAPSCGSGCVLFISICLFCATSLCKNTTQMTTLGVSQCWDGKRNKNEDRRLLFQMTFHQWTMKANQSRWDGNKGASPEGGPAQLPVWHWQDASQRPEYQFYVHPELRQLWTEETLTWMLILIDYGPFTVIYMFGGRGEGER